MNALVLENHPTHSPPPEKTISILLNGLSEKTIYGSGSVVYNRDDPEQLCDGECDTLKIDMHVHTARFSTCSTISPESAIEEARANGLDGLVFTEHNLFWPPEELEELRADYPGIELFNGAEIDVPSLHHVLTILPEPDHAVLQPDSPEQFIRDIRKREGVMIAAHPFRFYRDYDERNRNHSLDGVEIASRNMHDPDLRGRSETLASDWNSWTVANSDAHSPGPIGRFYSVLPEPVSTESELIRTLREESPRPEVPSHARE